jgi:hypothetical protein
VTTSARKTKTLNVLESARVSKRGQRVDQRGREEIGDNGRIQMRTPSEEIEEDNSEAFNEDRGGGKRRANTSAKSDV